MALVLYECSDRIATMTLNRPEAMNALNRELLRELRDALAQFRDDENAWVGVITGAGGRAFSAGADLKEMATRPPRAEGAAPEPSAFARRLQRSAGYMFGGTELW